MKTTLILAGLAALSLSACESREEAFGERVRAYLLEHPEVIQEAVTKLREKEMAAASQAATRAVQANRAVLERDPADLVANPGGTITVVEFFDYRCGYCKLATPEVMKILEENPDVRVVFKEMPIFGEVSETAAAVMLTKSAQAHGLELHNALMSEKALDEAGLDRHLRRVGLDPAKVKAEAKAPEIQAQLAETQALAESLNIDGTPAFVVGDRVVVGADIAALKAAIEVVRAEGLKPAGAS